MSSYENKPKERTNQYKPRSNHGDSRGNKNVMRSNRQTSGQSRSFSRDDRTQSSRSPKNDYGNQAKPVLLSIEKMGINGEGIGYIEQKPVFVDGAFPGEQVNIEITQQEKTYSKARLIRVEKPSAHRITEQFPVYTGHSYALIQMSVEEQLRQKRELVCQALRKYAHVSTQLIEDTVANPQPFGYRNQLKMPFGLENGKLVTGMYMPNSNHFIAVDHDIIHEEPLEAMRKKVLEVFNRYDYQPYDKRERKGLRTLVLRHLDGKFQCTIVTGRDNLSAPMVNELFALPGMAGIAHSINTNTGPDVFGKELRVVKGDLALPVQVNDLSLHVSCRSFFQLNTRQAATLYQLVHDLLAGGRYRLIIEAYSGVGGLGLSVRDLAQEVIGIENISSAVKNANENAQRNGANNVRFVLGDAGKEMRRLANTKKNIDVVIVDPPRVGLSDEFIIALLDTQPKHIVYVSCNPSTLGKDLSVLKQVYQVKRVIPLDMFTHTAHVECVVLMSRVGK